MKTWLDNGFRTWKNTPEYFDKGFRVKNWFFDIHLYDYQGDKNFCITLHLFKWRAFQFTWWF